MQSNRDDPSVNGSWRMDTGSGQLLMIVEDGYFAITSFSVPQKKFHGTYGGRMQVNADSMYTELEFNSSDTSKVGTTNVYRYELADEQLTMFENDHPITWTRSDEPATPLTGCWRISGRMNDGKLREMKPGSRKTLKILSGSCFQWVAINAQTKEFFGTGGGSYTFSDGKYTEHIEFFSRDSSRVGGTLVFDGKVENGVWHHSGKSSTGKPVNETWVKY